jgi:hypothetical protein
MTFKNAKYSPADNWLISVFSEGKVLEIVVWEI